MSAAIAQAVWEAGIRTLSGGSPSAPTTAAEVLAAAVWAYSERTLTYVEPELVTITAPVAEASAAGLVPGLSSAVAIAAPVARASGSARVASTQFHSTVVAAVSESPIASIPIEVVTSLLPSWFEVNCTSEPATAGYGKVVSAVIDLLCGYQRVSRLVDEEQWLTDRASNYPRLIWRARVRPGAADSVKTVSVSKGGHATSLRRVKSQFLLLFSDDPVYAVSSDGWIYMRNIAQTTETLASDTGTYQVTGGTLIPDECVWIRGQGRWEPLSCFEDIVDVQTGQVRLTEPGEITVKYSSMELLSETLRATVEIEGEESSPITVHDLWNPYDEAALLVGLTRVEGETNQGLASRIKIAYRLTRSDRDQIDRSLLGHELGLVGTLPWDGVSTVNFGASGIQNVTYACVLDLPRTISVNRERLLPDTDRVTFASENGRWDYGQVCVNGAPVTETTYPDMSISLGVVNFGREIPAEVDASYSYDLYTTDLDTLSPTVNTPVGEYTILYVTGVTTASASDQSVLDRLIAQDGSPSDLFLSILTSTASASPVLLGSTVWGRSPHWFNDNEASPQISHLPIPIR